MLGFDSKFGHDRGGTPESLKALGFEVEVAPKVVVGGRPVSSTAIAPPGLTASHIRVSSPTGRLRCWSRNRQ